MKDPQESEPLRDRICLAIVGVLFLAAIFIPLIAWAARNAGHLP